ncbi:HTTM domain-containing protein [Moheibacter lacus]|uniref:HTTM domain-containing protein n=1 Tax=Moheibacter lacus TaxID=2745851 RepID=A0A838ZL39_9FLAO|nr:HTTM domain-containing protein [Moheibacter lacus]MBA5628430.1 HTTM domain-containing protein [Moheibacter lacus]
MLSNILFQRIDNSQIIIFRIFFGLLMAVECWGSIGTGWVTETFVETKFSFTFIGFEWTRFLLGETMYYVYGFLGLMGIFIMLGAFYRITTVIFALGWSLVYFMQKEHYNNHYYLVMLIAWFMVFIPANRYKAVDVWLWPQIRSNYSYLWTRLIFILQLLIVYTFAALAKLYPGWMNGDFLMIRYRSVARWAHENIAWEPLTEMFRTREFAQVFSWLGFGFDLLIVPLLLWKRTRVFAFFAALFFHIFNSATLHIGIFPYFALALAIFCFPAESMRKLFFPRKTSFVPGSTEFQPRHKNQVFFSFVFSVYIIWQIYLPLRHWHIPGDVLWTEEGHRLSWRMMLRTKSATTQFFMVDKATGERNSVNLNEYMTGLQRNRVVTRPDMIWYFVQYLKKDQLKKGKEIEVYVHSRLSINRGPYHNYIDSSVDLADTKWEYFGHQDWILPEPEDYSKKEPIR